MTDLNNVFELDNNELNTVTAGDMPFYGANFSVNEDYAINEGILLAVGAGIAKGIGKAFGL